MDGSIVFATLRQCAPYIRDGTGSRVTGSAILTGSGRVTGQCVRSVFDQVLSFNMRFYRVLVSTEKHNLGKRIAA